MLAPIVTQSILWYSLGICVGSFIVLCGLSLWLPKRKDVGFAQSRQWHNLSLWLCNTLIVRLLMPVSLAGVALWAESMSYGVLHYVSLPTWAIGVLSLVLLDGLLYAQHWATHCVPLLWRLHQVHHSDHAMDSSTALRFHPLEMLVSFAIKALFIMILGVPALMVIVFEALLFICACFTHSNLQLPSKLDAILRYAMITPDVHRSHHSVHVGEQHSNYGFFLIFWDKWFGTYTPNPLDGHNEMQIGIDANAKPVDSLWQIFCMPFQRQK